MCVFISVCMCVFVCVCVPESVLSMNVFKNELIIPHIFRMLKGKIRKTPSVLNDSFNGELLRLPSFISLTLEQHGLNPTYLYFLSHP